MEPTDMPISMIDAYDPAAGRAAIAETERLAAERGIKVGQVWQAISASNASPPELEIEEFTSKRRYGLGTSMFCGEYPAVRFRRIKDGAKIYALIWRLNGKSGGYRLIRDVTPVHGKEGANEKA